MVRAVRLSVLFFLVLSLLVPGAAAADGVSAKAGAQRSIAFYRFFAPTGHSVSGAFLTFFDRYGGVDVFGYPLTEAFEEEGRLVQYFQRHRLEYWPENPPFWQVQLSLMGDLVLGAAQPPVVASADAAFLFYPETGHNLGPPFRDFFTSHGGLIIFGYPTSEAYMEGPYLVQRFQRARLEYRPQNPPAYQVEPGLLAVEYLQRQGALATQLMRPVPSLPVEPDWFLWGSWAESTSGFLPFKLDNVAIAVAALEGARLRPGEYINFNRALYAPGYVLGLGYGANNEYVWMRAGGVCSAATAMYRAAFNAGLEIVQVYPHTLASYPPYGWDATVQEGGPDLVIRNDTPTELRLRARLDRERQQLLFWFEGRTPPERTVVRRGPQRTGEWAYEVFRDITWADGRQRSERRALRYAGEAPPLPTVLPAQPRQ